LETKLAETGFFNNWKNGYIPPASTMSTTTPDPYGGFQSGTGTQGQVTTDPTAISIYNMDDAQRRQIALLLKSAGINVPTTGKYSEKLVNAYVAAAQAAALQSARLGREFTVREYLTQEAAGMLVILVQREALLSVRIFRYGIRPRLPVQSKT
jgi:hypothetical protein